MPQSDEISSTVVKHSDVNTSRVAVLPTNFIPKHSLYNLTPSFQITTTTMRIFAFHLLNDFSGSPKVLAQLTEGWAANGQEVHVCTSFMNEGFLSGIPSAINRHSVWYRFYENRLFRLLALVFSQLFLMVRMAGKVRRDDIIYINTVLPFGGALLGWLKGCRVIYHVHEITVKPRILKCFLFGVLKRTSDELVFVSQHLSKQEVFPGKRTHVLYNAIPERFLSRVESYPAKNTTPKNVLMICSLKSYKGVHEFVELARRLPAYRFRLVANAAQTDLDAFFSDGPLPDNLELYPSQSDVVPQYAWADLILNLSRPDGWIETFGLTIIEGMAFGLPAIVPEVGGITEVVEPGYNGYHADSRNVDNVVALIQDLFEDTARYAQLSANARQRLELFREKHFVETTLRILAGA
jgi:L-malate glycosyltransferase